MHHTCLAFAAQFPLHASNSRYLHRIPSTSPRRKFPSRHQARMQTGGVPSPYPSLLPTLVVENAESALSYYSSALDARVKSVERAEGRILHSVLETPYGVQLSIVDYFPGCVVDPLAPGGLVHGLFQYVSVREGGCDRAVERMVKVGGTLVEKPEDTLYGQRVGKVVDRYGVAWVFCA